MSTKKTEALKPLLDALTWYDEHSRLERAKRIEWASSLYQSPVLVAGKFVPLGLMEEARVCFVNGQYMATVLCATSVIEHLLVGELKAKGLNPKTTLGPLIKKIEEEGVFPLGLDIVERLTKLNNLRNPIAHRRPDEDVDNLENRYQKHQIHPDKLLEDDARFALELMYSIIPLMLRNLAIAPNISVRGLP